MILYGKNERLIFQRRDFGVGSRKRLIWQYPEFELIGVYAVTTQPIKRNLFNWSLTNLDAGQYKIFIGGADRDSFANRFPNYTWILTETHPFGGANFPCAILNQQEPFNKKQLSNWRFKNYIRYYNAECLLFDSNGARQDWITSMSKQIPATAYVLGQFSNAFTIKFLRDITY